mgnify:CR=1 FL=1
MMKDLKLERYLREYGDPDVVATLEIELYVRKDAGENRVIELPLGPESSDITFDELSDITSEYYKEKYDTDEVYGFAYKIIEK